MRRFFSAVLCVLVLAISLVAVAKCPNIIIDGQQQYQNCDQTFAGSVTFPGTVSIPGGVTDPTAPKQTTAAATYYVRTDGNDSNTCLGNTALLACATVQGALNKLPQFIKHAIVINVGAGTFPGFALKSLYMSAPAASLSISGALGAPTLTTGTASGTADGGSVVECADSGQAWTVNELRGRLMHVGAEYRVVQNNTATSAFLVGALGASCSGSAYSLVEQKTILNTDGGNSSVVSASDIRSFGKEPQWHLWDLKLAPPWTDYGFSLQHGGGGHLERIAVITGAAGVNNSGISWQDSGGTRISMFDIYSTGSSGNGIELKNNVMALESDNGRWYVYSVTGDGIRFVNSTYVGVGELYIDSPGASGLVANTVSSVYVQNLVADAVTAGAGFWGENVGKLAFDNASITNVLAGVFLPGFTGNGYIGSSTGLVTVDTGWYGIVVGQPYIGAGTYTPAPGSVTLKNTTISNFSLIGLYIVGGTAMCLACAGSGNTWGAQVEGAGQLFFNTGSVIEGTTGDLSLNGGVTETSWTTDFPTDGDIVVNDATGSRATRRDNL